MAATRKRWWLAMLLVMVVLVIGAVAAAGETDDSDDGGGSLGAKNLKLIPQENSEIEHEEWVPPPPEPEPELPLFEGYLDAWVPPYRNKEERTENHRAFVAWFKNSSSTMLDVKIHALEIKPDISENEGEDEGVWPRARYSSNDLHNSMAHRRLVALADLNDDNLSLYELHQHEAQDTDAPSDEASATPSTTPSSSALIRLREPVVLSLRAMLYSDIGTRWSWRELKRIQNEFPDMAHRYQVFLSLFLIHETKKGAASSWHPYINVLPRRFHHPLVWNDTVLAELQASPLLDAVKAARKQLNSDYGILTQLFTHPMQGFTHSMFSWAMLVTTSHMVSFELRDPMIRVIALLPVVDIPRRHFNPETALSISHDADQQEFVFSTSFPYRKGAEVFDADRKCDSYHCTLLHYGYIPSQDLTVGPAPSNYSHVNYLPLILVTPSAEDPTVPTLLYSHFFSLFGLASSFDNATCTEKAKVLAKHNLGELRLDDSRDGSKQAITAMRLVMMSASEIRSTASVAKVVNGKKLNTANEKRMIQALAALMASSLAKYATTYQADLELFEQVPESEIELRLAIQIRIIEKRIYGQLLEQLYRMQPVLVLDAIEGHISVPMMEEAIREANTAKTKTETDTEPETETESNNALGDAADLE